MEDKELNLLLKNALSTNFEPDSKLNTKIMEKVRENEMNNTRKLRRIPVVAVVCCVLLCCSVTAFAAWKFLTPKDVAIEYGNQQLATAFESDDAILMDESQTYDEYTVKLLGAVSGGNLTGFCTDGQVVSERTYAVVAIAKQMDFRCLRLPRMIMESIHSLYLHSFKDLILSSSTFYDRDAYGYDEKTGMISVNKSYKGMNLLFDFPLNKDNADKEAAQQYLKEFAFLNETCFK